jgi:hypothetical protein
VVRCKGVGSKPDSRVCVSDAMIGSFVITAVQKWIAGDKHHKVVHLTFRDLLTAFAAAVEVNDGEGLASLFTEDGTYEDGLFGAHTGRPAIATMLQRFHDTGRAYLWEFFDPLSDGSIGYARFRFSYASPLPEAAWVCSVDCVA